MTTTPATCAAPAARNVIAAPLMPRWPGAGRLRRLAATTLLLACSGLARPAAADEPAHPRPAPARDGGALLLLSFLVPLPLPMALVAPPEATRVPAARATAPRADPCSSPQPGQGCVATRPDSR
jgi:hypothetical protein